MSETMSQAPPAAAERLEILRTRLAGLETARTETRRALDAAELEHRTRLQGEMVSGIPYSPEARREAVEAIREMKDAAAEIDLELAAGIEAVPVLERAAALELFASHLAEARTLAAEAGPIAESALAAANDFLAGFSSLARIAHRRQRAVDTALRLQGRNGIQPDEAPFAAGRFPVDLEALGAAIEAALATRNRHKLVAGPAPKISAEG